LVNNKQKRDDVTGRLFFLLRNEYGLRVKNIKTVKHNVWVVTACEGYSVIKRYRTFFEAMRQALFMQSLRKAGFVHVPAIYTTLGQNGVFFFEGAFWTMQTYISDAERLSFARQQDIADGLELLQTYHSIARLLIKIPLFQTIVPYCHLYGMWQRRYYDFYAHLSLIERIMDKEDIAWTIRHAEYCLSTFASYMPSLAAEPVTIIHGDVAPHNFLRTKEGMIYLIDYDTIAIASPGIDYLQYASRILPHLQWSFSQLYQFPVFSFWLTKPWFLHALLFPADIMREWRFALQHNKPLSIARKERKQFVRKIIDMIK
jgi:hypothetical protein